MGIFQAATANCKFLLMSERVFYCNRFHGKKLQYLGRSADEKPVSVYYSKRRNFYNAKERILLNT